MKISRFGNQHSDILDSLINKANEKKEANPELSFDKIAAEILTKQKKSLRDVLKEAQLGDALTEEIPSGEIPPGEPPIDETEGLPEEPLPGEEGADMEAVKSSLVDALISACGSVEEAKMCLEDKGGVEEMAEESIDEGLPPEGPPEPEIGPEPMGEEPLDMPKPMMQEPAQPMPMPQPMPAPMGM